MNKEWRREYMKYEWDKMEEGKEKGILLVAKNLLDKMSDEEIASISKVNSLRKVA